MLLARRIQATRVLAVPRVEMRAQRADSHGRASVAQAGACAQRASYLCCSAIRLAPLGPAGGEEIADAALHPSFVAWSLHGAVLRCCCNDTGPRYRDPSPQQAPEQHALMITRADLGRCLNRKTTLE